MGKNYFTPEQIEQLSQNKFVKKLVKKQSPILKNLKKLLCWNIR